MWGRIARPIRRFTRWLFGAPFEDLPPGFGKSMPEIRAFKQWTRLNIARMAMRQRGPSGGTNVPGRPADANDGGKNGCKNRHTALGSGQGV